MKLSLPDITPAAVPTISTPAVDPRFAGIERLYGVGTVARLASRHVAVVGLGGVGSWAPRRWRAVASVGSP